MPYYPEKKPAVVSCLLSGYGGISLIRYYSDLAASRQTSAELRQVSRPADAGTEPSLPEKEETAVPSPAPVPAAQKDNTFFLKHDALGKRNSNGTIFLDEGIRLFTRRSYTLFLYGHNMKSGNMCRPAISSCG